MVKYKKGKTTEKQMHHYFLILKGCLAIAPFICYFYVSMQGWKQNLTVQEVLVNDPNMTILFLIAMIHAYIAYLVHQIEKQLKTNNPMFAIINMALLLVAQIVTMNVIYVIIVGYVFYKAIHYYRVDIKAFVKWSTWKQTLLYGGGSIFVMIVSSICFFASMQLM